MEYQKKTSSHLKSIYYDVLLIQNILQCKKNFPLTASAHVWSNSLVALFQFNNGHAVPLGQKQTKINLL